MNKFVKFEGTIGRKGTAPIKRDICINVDRINYIMPTTSGMHSADNTLSRTIIYFNEDDFVIVNTELEKVMEVINGSN